MKTQYVCSNCMSTHVQETRWVEINTNVVYEAAEPPEYWCPDCEEHPARVVQLEIPFDKSLKKG